MKTAYRLREYSDSNRPHLKWVVAFSESGRRARKFFETKTAANTFIDLKEIEVLNQGKEGAEFPTALRVMATACDDLLRPFGKTIRDATEHFLDHLKTAAKSCTVEKLVEEMQAAKKADGASARYLSDLKTRLNRFKAEFGKELASDISGPLLDDWLRSLKLSPTSRNNFRRVLSVLFKYAKERGYVVGNPAESTSKAKVVDQAPGILTVKQAADLLGAASEDVLPMVAIGLFAGLRQAELARIDWEHVDLAAGLIEVTAEKSKTARRRFIKIQDNLAQWLAPYTLHRGPVACPNARKLLEAARTAAKIEEWPNNALRHSFASYHLAHFNDAAKLALEMGHTDSGMIFSNYRQLVKPKDAAIFWQIAPAWAEGGNKVTAFTAA